MLPNCLPQLGAPANQLTSLVKNNCIRKKWHIINLCDVHQCDVSCRRSKANIPTRHIPSYTYEHLFCQTTIKKWLDDIQLRHHRPTNPGRQYSTLQVEVPSSHANLPRRGTAPGKNTQQMAESSRGFGGQWNVLEIPMWQMICDMSDMTLLYRLIVCVCHGSLINWSYSSLVIK